MTVMSRYLHIGVLSTCYRIKAHRRGHMGPAINLTCSANREADTEAGFNILGQAREAAVFATPWTGWLKSWERNPKKFN